MGGVGEWTGGGLAFGVVLWMIWLGWMGREGKCIICISVEWSIERERVGGMYNILSGSLHGSTYLPTHLLPLSIIPTLCTFTKKKQTVKPTLFSCTVQGANYVSISISIFSSYSTSVRPHRQLDTTTVPHLRARVQKVPLRARARPLRATSKESAPCRRSGTSWPPPLGVVGSLR